MRLNSAFIFVASAASFIFYMNVMYIRFNHAPQSPSVIAYDVGDDRVRSANRSRLRTALRHTQPGARRQETTTTELAQLRRLDKEIVLIEKNTSLDGLVRIFAGP